MTTPQRRTDPACVAHDVLTPVAAVQGFVDLLRVTPVEEQGPLLDRIEHNVARAVAMVRELVASTDHTDHATDHAAEPLEPADLLEAVRTRLGGAFALDRLRLDLTCPARVHAERSAMERVLTNVVGNALAYSETGPVEVAVQPDGAMVELVVTDHGRGIDPADVPRVFDAWERGRLATDDGGSGLGLASARQLVHEQGGEISLRSVVGQGTVVTVRVPADDPGADLPLR